MTISMGIDNVLTQSDINNIAEFVHAVNVLQNDGLTVTQENLNEVMELFIVPVN